MSHERHKYWQRARYGTNWGKNSSDAEYKCEILEIGMGFTCFKKSLAREFVAIA